MIQQSESILSLSILFLSFSPSSGYISILLTFDTRWIWKSMPAVPTLVQIDAVTTLSILYVSMVRSMSLFVGRLLLAHYVLLVLNTFLILPSMNDQIAM
jgi:hypothetical protein